MVVTRWQASVVPTTDQIRMIFQSEGLEPLEEVLEPKQMVTDHRHPFDEVRIVSSGTMVMNISGNQVLLRSGDRIEIPANTRHSMSSGDSETCVCFVANRPS